MTAPVADPAASEAPGAPAEARPDDAAPDAAGVATSDDRWARLVFLIALAAAFPLMLWVGRDHWFYVDEWWILTRDGLAQPGYFDGHNGHWITVVVLDYRLNFQLWGISTYLPYQVPVVLAHLASAALLRAVMVRAGVRGWIATVAALTFVFFGSGRDNITYGFQISLTGSLLLGLAVLLISDRPGPVVRADWLGLGLGVIGLMTSSVFLPFVGGLTVALLLRRGLRVAAFYAVPLGLVYGAWYSQYGGSDTAEPLQLTAKTVGFAAGMVASAFRAVAQTGAGGVVLFLLAVGGLVIAVVHGARHRFDDHTAPVIALAVTWAAFAALTSLARANGAFTAGEFDASRYLHIGAALLLPLVALGCEHLARRRALLGAAAVVVLLTGLPGNLDRLRHTDPLFLTNPELFDDDSREILQAMAYSEHLDDVPADWTPVNKAFIQLPLTAGWLQRNAAAGRIPEPSSISPELRLTATNYLILAQQPGTLSPAACPVVAEPQRVEMQAGDGLAFDGNVTVTVTEDGESSRPRLVRGALGHELEALVGPVTVVVEPADATTPHLCAPEQGA